VRRQHGERNGCRKEQGCENGCTARQGIANAPRGKQASTLPATNAEGTAFRLLQHDKPNQEKGNNKMDGKKNGLHGNLKFQGAV
jgi:hypothetical protein